MKILTTTTKYILTAAVLLSLSVIAFSQAKYSTKAVNMSVSGTSTMHDWVMKSTAGDCSATFTVDATGKVTDLSAMTLTVSSKALKSGKDAMDKNAYKALKADKNPSITATLKSAEITTKDNKTYTIKSVIKLTIAGKTLETDLIATAKRVNDTTISVKGEKKLSMKDYGMEPPSFMLGAVKTGNDVVLAFDVTLNQ
jgi:polyisoprenoid-binding protein YceI